MVENVRSAARIQNTQPADTRPVRPAAVGVGMGESNGSTPGGASSEKVIAMGGAVRFSVSLSPWASWGQSFVMRAPYRAGPSPVPGDLGVEVEGRHRGVVFVVTPLVAGDHPHDFELVAVEIMAVDRLRRSVVRLADVR